MKFFDVENFDEIERIIPPWLWKEKKMPNTQLCDCLPEIIIYVYSHPIYKPCIVFDVLICFVKLCWTILRFKGKAHSGLLVLRQRLILGLLVLRERLILGLLVLRERLILGLLVLREGSLWSFSFKGRISKEIF